MVTNAGLVVQQSRSDGSVSSELSGVCSGQGLVAEHNTDDASTVFTSCTKRLPKEPVDSFVADGYISQDIVDTADSNVFAYEISRLILFLFQLECDRLLF